MSKRVHSWPIVSDLNQGLRVSIWEYDGEDEFREQFEVMISDDDSGMDITLSTKQELARIIKTLNLALDTIVEEAE